MRRKLIPIAGLALLGATVLGGAIAAPAVAAPGETVTDQVRYGDRFPGANTRPVWFVGTLYREGDIVSFNDSDYRLTAAGATAYREYHEDGVLRDSSYTWNLAPEQFAVVTADNQTFAQHFRPGLWTLLGTSTRVGYDRGLFLIGEHLYFNVNDTTTYDGRKYIATAWSTDVYPTDTRYFALVG